MNQISRLAAVVIFTLLSSCGERSAAVRVCIAASGANSESPIGERCRCIDDLARRQLGPERYGVIHAAARAAEREGSHSSVAGITASVDVLGRTLIRANSAERVIAAGDAALITAKAAVRCK